ncbi:MAG: ABC transporter permease, partial [Clostridia bacterium]|nr:ABC transporter permease [Clostridia bacterium]
VWKPNLAIFGSYLFGGLYILFNYIDGASMEMIPVLKMLPYLVTIVVLIVVSMRKKKENQPPASLGLSYFREER